MSVRREALPVLQFAAGNNASYAAIWASDSLLLRIASCVLWDAVVIGGGGGGIPSFFFSNTSPLFTVGMCDRGCAAILVLLVWMWLLRGSALCLGGLAIRGAGLVTSTFTLNRSSLRAASFGVGVDSG
jgi:hypothetical protein